MKDDKNMIIGTKVANNVTNVRSFPWCKSHCELDFQTNQVVCIVEKVDYISKSDIRPTQCFILTLLTSMFSLTSST
jgi:hypothetical protein